MYCCENICPPLRSTVGLALGYANYIEIVVTVLVVLCYIYVFKKDVDVTSNEIFAIAQEAEEKDKAQQP